MCFLEHGLANMVLEKQKDVNAGSSGISVDPIKALKLTP